MQDVLAVRVLLAAALNSAAAVKSQDDGCDTEHDSIQGCGV